VADLLKSVPESLQANLPNALEADENDISQSIDKWKELGPISLLDIYRDKNVHFESEFSNLQYGEYNYKHGLYKYVGQLNIKGQPHGLGRRISSKTNRIVEGQFKNGETCGYARYIWENGDYYIG